MGLAFHSRFQRPVCSLRSIAAVIHCPGVAKFSPRLLLRATLLNLFRSVGQKRGEEKKKDREKTRKWSSGAPSLRAMDRANIFALSCVISFFKKDPGERISSVSKNREIDSHSRARGKFVIWLSFFFSLFFWNADISSLNRLYASWKDGIFFLFNVEYIRHIEKIRFFYLLRIIYICNFSTFQNISRQQKTKK